MLKPKCSYTKLNNIYMNWKEVSYYSVSNESSIYDIRQFSYRRAKTRGKVLNELQSKFFLCELDNLEIHGEMLLVIPI